MKDIEKKYGKNHLGYVQKNMKKINFGKTVSENFEKIVADFDSDSVKSDGAASRIFNRMERPRNPRYDKNRHK